ncbi:Oidioi.mRNA.OKI2018_I69.XSR.g13456.t1.cds [Oikopleura dioica]|uniref:Oidioi.mRNA.OKI2018_I69.XSR.g13456.t1.cds n=1 Tax=Oikopleura dioica TaxID=34765 RepID=A0ABN7SD26_OIKDI|nr:Oidioi.mRNA.OKI2018_I69.XSR.g13456.t1.cds [Oikopleura dioica]
MAWRREKECNWIEHEFNKNKTTSIVLYKCKLQKSLDIGKMNDAWEYTVRDHENLSKTIRMEERKTSSVFMNANQPLGESHKKIEYLKNIDIPAFLEQITNQDDEITLKAVPFRLWIIINNEGFRNIKQDKLWICFKLPRSMADNKSMQIVVNDLLQHYDGAYWHQGMTISSTYKGKIFETQDIKIEAHDNRKQQLKHFHGGLNIPVSRGEVYKMTDPCGVLTASIKLHDDYKNPTERQRFICKAMVASIFGMCEMRVVNKNSISPRLPLLDFEVDFDFRNLHGNFSDGNVSYENTMGNFSFDINYLITKKQKIQEAKGIHDYIWKQFFEDEQTNLMTFESRIFEEYPAKEKHAKSATLLVQLFVPIIKASRVRLHSVLIFSKKQISKREPVVLIICAMFKTFTLLVDTIHP